MQPRRRAGLAGCRLWCLFAVVVLLLSVAAVSSKAVKRARDSESDGDSEASAASFGDDSSSGGGGSGSDDDSDVRGAASSVDGSAAGAAGESASGSEGEPSSGEEGGGGSLGGAERGVRERRATAADAVRLSRTTHALGVSLEHLTLSMASVVGQLSGLIKERRKRLRKANKVDDTEGFDKSASLAIKKLGKKTKAVFKDTHTMMDAHSKEITEKIKAKGCTKDEPDARSGGGVFTNPTAARSPNPDPCEDSDDEYCRRDEVKAATKSAWASYKRYAWGQDELMPLTKRGKNWARGVERSFGLTIHDSLTTLYLLGLHDEFEEAVRWIEDSFDPSTADFKMSAFESTIRMVGGLVSAYELSGEKHESLLHAATDMANRLMHAYNTSTGIPHATINLRTLEHSNPPWSGGASVLSEFGTVQLEFRTLTYHTKNPDYDVKGTWLMDLVDAIAPDDYLCPTYLHSASARWTSGHVTLGALGDSFFEYLLKQYLLTGKTEKRYRDAYLKVQRGIMKRLVMRGRRPHQPSYFAEFKQGQTLHKMDHLACFAAGMLALGVQEIDRDDTEEHDKAHGNKWDEEQLNRERAETLQAAEEVAETCYQMYHKTATGVSPEYVEFWDGELKIPPRASYYLLRPEASEAMFYLWRITKKEKYREWGWEMFKAIKRWCAVPGGGWSGLRNIDMLPPQQDDLQQSFFIAETLKYQYLLFADDDALDLSEWVLNTEAHPMKIRKRDPLTSWDSKRRETREKDTALSLQEKLYRYLHTQEILKPFESSTQYSRDDKPARSTEQDARGTGELGDQGHTGHHHKHKHRHKHKHKRKKSD